MDTRTELIDLMSKYGLKVSDVAELLEVSKFTVMSWRRPLGSKNGREVPLHRIRMLRIMLEGTTSED